MKDLDDLLALRDRLVDPRGELALLVELVGPDDLAVHAEGLDGVEEGLHEVVCIVVVLPARAGDAADGHADVFLVLLGEERVAFPQGVEVVDDVDEFDIRSGGMLIVEAMGEPY